MPVEGSGLYLDCTPGGCRSIYYVDVTKAFTGHAIGGKVMPPFINEPPSGEAFHPTADGYGAYADAIKTKLPVGWLNKQDPLA